MTKNELTYADGERERQFLAMANSELRSDNLILQQEVERLRAASDALAHAVSVWAKWAGCIDGQYGSFYCPPDAAQLPIEDAVATALHPQEGPS